MKKTTYPDIEEGNISHPDSYNTGDFENPVITYEEYIKKKEDSNNAINQSSDNT